MYVGKLKAIHINWSIESMAASEYIKGQAFYTFISSPTIFFVYTTQSCAHTRSSMALSPIVSFHVCSNTISSTTRLQPACPTGPHSVAKSKTRSSLCSLQSTKNSGGNNIARRSANYQAPIWQFDYVQSLKSEFVVTNFIYFLLCWIWC